MNAAQERSEADWESVTEVLIIGLREKAAMIACGVNRRTIDCPRCASQIHLALVGRRGHLRMACDGGCGMDLME